MAVAVGALVFLITGEGWGGDVCIYKYSHCFKSIPCSISLFILTVCTAAHSIYMRIYDYRGDVGMRTTINIDDQLIKEAEAIYKAESRSKAIEYALRDAIRMKKMEQLKSLIGKVEFDEEAMRQLRDSER